MKRQDEQCATENVVKIGIAGLMAGFLWSLIWGEKFSPSPSISIWTIFLYSALAAAVFSTFWYIVLRWLLGRSDRLITAFSLGCMLTYGLGLHIISGNFWIGFFGGMGMILPPLVAIVTRDIRHTEPLPITWPDEGM